MGEKITQMGDDKMAKSEKIEKIQEMLETYTPYLNKLTESEVTYLMLSIGDKLKEKK